LKNKYDIVIIGSGIGGLVSAALLAESGKSILIVEKEPSPGGYLKVFRENGFMFDVSLHLLNGCAEGGYNRHILRKCGILDKIKFLKPKYLYRSIFPDYDLKIPQENVEGFKEMLLGRFPSEKNGINGLFKEISDVHAAIVSHDKNNSKHTPLLLSYCRHTFGEVISKYIKNKKLKALICQMWSYFGLPSSMVRAIDFAYPWFDYIKNGGYYIRRGSSSIVNALTNTLKEKGVDIIFDKNVDKIVIEKNTCTDVKFGGEKVQCNTVISNADIFKTIYGMIGREHFSEKYIKKIQRIEPSISNFEIFIGMKTNLKKIYPEDYEIFVSSNYDEDSQYKASLENNVKKAPFNISIYSNVDDSLTSKSKSIVTLNMLSGYDFWITESKEEYQDKKQDIADMLIKRAAKVIPELSSQVEKKVISTPVTFKRYTSNAKGAIYGYARTAGGSMEIRPNDLKGINNLYFSNAWAMQGSGIEKVLRSAEDVCSKITKNTQNRILAS